MSHFLMGVIIRGGSKKAESYFSVLKNKLTYYDEYLEVPEYEAICKYCNLVDPCLGSTMLCSGEIFRAKNELFRVGQKIKGAF